MEFKEQESLYWSNFYSRQNIDWHSDRDLLFHNHYKDYLRKLGKNSKILELACGIRCDGIEMAKEGHYLTETDIAEEAVSKVRLIYQKLNIIDYGEFLVCDAEKMEFLDNYFDAVFISASFHHLPHPKLAIKEMSRVVKSGGLVILGLEPNAWPYFTIYRLLEPIKKIIRNKSDLKFHSIADDTTKGFTKKQLMTICQSANLEIVKIFREKYLTELYDSGLRFLNKFFKLKISSNSYVQKTLCQIDNVIQYIPFINLMNWHWSIICKKK